MSGESNRIVYTVREVAEMLGVSEITLLRMRQKPNASGLPYVQLSTQRVGYMRADVEAFLRSKRVGKLYGEE